MRILVVSDTHGNQENLELALETQQNIDMVIHAGDAQVSEKELMEMIHCPLEIVAGNMDKAGSFPLEKMIEVNGARILICHGHRHQVKSGLLRLEYAAREQEADIVIYGHTHVPFFEDLEDLLIINPGSLSYPRLWGETPSYGILTIDDFGEVEFQHFYI